MSIDEDTLNQFVESHDGLKRYQFDIEKLNKIKKQIGEALYKVYIKQLYYKDRKLTPDNCFYLTKNKINNALLYAQKKFYEFLQQTMISLNRI